MASALFCGTILNDGQYLKHDIQRSNASTFRLADYPALAESGFLFARKFTA